MTKIAFAINEIQLGSAKTGDIIVVAPNSVFATTDAQFAELEALGAVREPEEAEVALFEKLEELQSAGVTADADTKAADDKAAADAKAAEDKAAADAKTTDAKNAPKTGADKLVG